MGKIVLLDDLTINKIAAGEVIERPASVVKEMVENSIDAGAKNITVEIKNGGISLIKITDDGSGISEDDMEIAFERHATSKIRKAEDLETVMTMGFRGEALASIAAIANVEMISKRENDEIGHKLVIEGGKILEKSEIGAPVGTQITVKNLFYNTPVRYKFLKKDFTETGYIEDVITRIALVNKDISLKLINTGKTIIQTNGNGNMESLIYSIYGKDIAKGITEVEYLYEDIKVTGVVGKAEIARSNRSHQLFFVNNRYVKDKNLSAAVDQAYKGLVPAGKYGFVILNLNIDPKKVDVNVHPAKLEVRFEDEGKIFKSVYHTIKEGLSRFENNEKIFPSVNQKNEFNVNENENQIEENKIQELKKEEFKPRSNAFSGFFKRLIKESEETKEEVENNNLRDIFENRKNAKERLFDDFSRTKNEDAIKKAGINEIQDEENETESEERDEILISKSIDNEDAFILKNNKNDDDIVLSKNNNYEKSSVNEYKKEVKLGNTIISSETKDLEVNVNDFVKQDTVNIETTKKIESQKLNTEVISTLKELSNISSEETISIEPVSKIQKEEIKNESYSNNSSNVEDINKKQDNDPKNIDTVTEKILKMKMESNIDDTQLIDTARIRDGIEDSKESITKEFADMYKRVFGMDVSSVRKNKEQEEAKLNASDMLKYENQENASFFENKNNYISEIKYKFIGIIFDSYIIIEIKDEMYLIDAKTAKERIMYEKVKLNFYSDFQKDSQMLLLADIVTLSHKEMNLAKENKEMFKQAGFDFEEFGDNTVKLTAVPSMCEALNTKKLFLEILDEMDTVAVTAKEEKEEKFIVTIANKTISMEKIKLDVNESENILKKLLSYENPFIYSYGKQTAIKITRNDLEKKFSRR